MIFWFVCYLSTLLLVGVKSKSLFMCAERKEKTSFKTIVIFVFVICSNLFALSFFTIKSIKFLGVGEYTQILILTLSGIPLAIVIALGVSIVGKDET